MFGEKVLDIDENALQDNSKNGISKPVKEVDIVKKKRVRGWFPRKCAVELYEEYDDDEEEDNIEPVLLPNELNESISHEKAE